MTGQYVTMYGPVRVGPSETSLLKIIHDKKLYECAMIENPNIIVKAREMHEHINKIAKRMLDYRKNDL